MFLGIIYSKEIMTVQFTGIFTNIPTGLFFTLQPSQPSQIGCIALVGTIEPFNPPYNYPKKGPTLPNYPKTIPNYP